MNNGTGFSACETDFAWAAAAAAAPRPDDAAPPDFEPPPAAAARADHPRAAAPAPFDAWPLVEFLLRRWYWLLIGGGILAALGLYTARKIWPGNYTCAGELVCYQPPSAGDSFVPQALSASTLVYLIQSPDLLGKIGAGLQPPLSAGELGQALKVTADSSTGTITVAATGNSPRGVAGMVGGFCTAAVVFSQGIQRKEAATLVAQLNAQLANIESEHAALSQRIPVAQQTVLDRLPPSESEKITEKIQAAREDLSTLLLSYTDAHPLVQAQRAKLAVLTRELAQQPAAPRPVAAAPKPATPNPDYDGLRNQLRDLETSYGQIDGRRRSLQAFMANPPGYFRALLPATVADARQERHRMQIGLFTVFCGLLGLLGTTGGLLGCELQDNRLKTRADVKRVTRLPLLATLGNVRHLSLADREQWAFRTWVALQSRLSPSPHHGMVCGVTSAQAGEGRSTWINLLAQAANQHGFRVLTIATHPEGGANDGAVATEVSADDGAPESSSSTALTASLLSTPAEVSEKLLGPDPQPMVHIPLPGWVWNLEQRKQFQSALNAWRKIDNVVILVELPPAGRPEAVLLAENLPNLIWLTESGKPDASETRTQLLTLRQARCNLVGAVLNRETAPPLVRRFSRWSAAGVALLATLGGLGGTDASSLRAQEIAAPAPAGAMAPAEDFSSEAAGPAAPWQRKLTLGTGDLLNLSLYGHPELSRENVPVGPDGRIGYLEAQNVMAAGLTVDELRDRLTRELAKYRRAPTVIVVPSAYLSKKYFVLGEVTQPGVYLLDRPTTIIEAVARAHGLAAGQSGRGTMELADFSRSFLARDGRHMPVDFQKLFHDGDLTQNIPLQPGDYLYFPAGQSQEVYVLGEVHFPGPLNYTPDTTALTAIAGRGGFTDRAWERRILVVRGSLSHPQAFVVNPQDVLAAKTIDFQLLPGDIVYVSHRPWIKATDLLDDAVSAFVQSAVVTWTGLRVDLPLDSH